MGASSRPFDLTPKEVAIKWQRSADLGRWAVKDKGSTGRGRPHRTRGRGSFEGGGSGRPAAFLRGALFVLFAGRCANPRLPPGVPFLEGRKRGALSPEGAGGAAATASAQSPVGGGAGGTGPPLFPRPPGSRAERNWPGVWGYEILTGLGLGLASSCLPDLSTSRAPCDTRWHRRRPQWPLQPRNWDTESPRARRRGPWFGGERGWGRALCWSAGLRAAGFAGGGIRRRRERLSPCSFGEHKEDPPPPRLGRLRQVTWHILLEAGFRLGFQGLLASLGPSAARDPSVAEVAVSQPGRCHGPPRLPQTAVPIHTDSVPAFSAASPTPAFRAAGGATSLAASLLSQLSLSGRVRAQQVPRGWALLPRAARLCARGNDAGPETRPLRVRVTCVRGPLTSQPRPGPATPDTLGATKSEHEPRLSRTLWGREKKKKKGSFLSRKCGHFTSAYTWPCWWKQCPPNISPAFASPRERPPTFKFSPPWGVGGGSQRRPC